MTRRGADRYRAVQIESAPPPRVLLEIYRRLELDLQGARRCLAAQDLEGKARAVDHALALLGQLEAALDHALAPALCRDLAALYDFCKNRLLLASVRLDPAPLDEAERALAPIREAFRAVIDPPDGPG
jgi:flagellar protein FliS